MFSAAGKSAVTSGYNINNSLRFRASASARLSRTFGTPTNTSTWTLSTWLKRGDVAPTTAATIIASRPSSTTTAIYFNSTGNLVFWNNEAVAATSTAIFRDPSAWYHVVVSSNGTTTTAYVNNETVLTWTGDLALINNSGTHYIGHAATTGNRDFDGYFAETYFVDGQALTPSSFGETNATTGVWKPKAYSGSYGTNGFYLNFSDIALTSGSNAGLGKDFSGNSNYWTTTNISVTAGSTYDAMTDSPTLTSPTVGNYCVMNAVQIGGTNLTNGNLQIGLSSGNINFGTLYATSGKFYFETVITTQQTQRQIVGIANELEVTTSGLTGVTANSWGIVVQNNASNGQTYNNAVFSASYTTYTTGDIVMVAFDVDNKRIWFGKNGTWLNSSNPSAGTGSFYTLTGTGFVPAITNTITAGVSLGVNFGQRPFTYTPPTGFLALNTFNLPTSTIVKGNSFMDATLYAGNSVSPRSITNAASFRPDFVWIKSRTDGAVWHILNDSNRGANRNLFSNVTNGEVVSDANGWLSAFNNDGFALATGTAFTNVNTTGNNYVAWQWQAGQGTNSSNTNGTIPSTVSVNATAGFSIVTYTGTGANGTVGHGLGVAPAMIIVKRRNGTGNWQVRHRSIAAANSIQLNLTNAAASATTVWNSTAPTSTVFSIGTATTVNVNTDTYVAYCWAEIAGFSAFGSYTGNGSTDGPFIYTGFRPRFVMFKGSSFATEWNIYDTSRSSYNLLGARLDANAASAETADAYIDVLSNGFKFRTSLMNDNGQTFIYAAFAENPFKNSLAR